MCAQKSLQKNRNQSANAVKKAMEQPQIAGAIATRHESFEGPLPHPEILKQYDATVPGLAERIVVMAEKEQEARLEIAKEDAKQKSRIIDVADNTQKDNAKAMLRGQRIGLAISGICTLFAAYFAWLTLDWKISAVFLAVPTGSFIASFMPKYRELKNNTKSTPK